MEETSDNFHSQQHNVGDWFNNKRKMREFTDNQIGYCKKNYDQVIEFLQSSPNRSSLFIFLGDNPSKDAEITLKRLIIDSPHEDFRGSCISALKPYHSSANVKFVKNLLYELDNGLRYRASNLLRDWGEDGFFSIDESESGNQNIVDIMTNYLQYGYDGYNVLLTKLGSQLSRTWDRFSLEESSSWSARRDIIEALIEAPEKLRDDLEIMLEKITLFIERSSNGVEWYGTPQTKIENVLFLCAHGLNTPGRMKKLQRLTRRLLNYNSPKHPDGSDLTKWHNEHYAEVRLRALYILEQCEDSTGIAKILGMRR